MSDSPTIIANIPILDAIVRSWIPPIASVIVGGLLASVLVPRIQKKFEINKSVSLKKIELAEKIAASFPKYIMNWKRLIQISQFEIEKGELSEEQKTKKMEFANKRNENREALFEMF